MKEVVAVKYRHLKLEDLVTELKYKSKIKRDQGRKRVLKQLRNVRQTQVREIGKGQAM